MRVMTSQYEISGKNHICSVKTFSFRGIIYAPINVKPEGGGGGAGHGVGI